MSDTDDAAAITTVATPSGIARIMSRFTRPGIPRTAVSVVGVGLAGTALFFGGRALLRAHGARNYHEGYRAGVREATRDTGGSSGGGGGGLGGDEDY